VLLAASLFCVASAILLRRLIASPWLRLAGFAMLTLNPYTMDYFVAARGYGLMIAFVMLALVLLAPGVGTPPSAARAAAVGALFGLSAAAMPITLFPFVGLVCGFIVCEALSRRLALALRRAAIAGAVALGIAATLLATQIYHGERGDYYLGAPTLAAALASVVRASWRHVDPTVPSLAALSSLEQVVCAATIASMLAIAVLAVQSMRRWPETTARERTLVWLVLSLSTIVIQVVMAHWVAGLPYPGGRTAIYWIPLATLTAILAVDSLQSRSLPWAVAWSLTVIVLTKDAMRFQTRAFADENYDAPGRAIIAKIVDVHGRATRRETVGGSWQTEPAMNFYRLTRGLDWMAPVERNPPAPGYDYYVLIREDAAAVKALDLHVLLADGVSGTWLAAPKRQE